MFELHPTRVMLSNKMVQSVPSTTNSHHNVVSQNLKRWILVKLEVMSLVTLEGMLVTLEVILVKLEVMLVKLEVMLVTLQVILVKHEVMLVTLEGMLYVELIVTIEGI